MATADTKAASTDEAKTTTPETKSDAPHGTEVEAPTVESLQAKIEELTRESRKWEARAKDNKTAAAELAQIREANLTDEERRAAETDALTKRAAEAEERAAKAEAAIARYKIAAKYGISDEDADLLLTASDEAGMEKQAKRIAAEPESRSPRPNKAQGSTTRAPATKAEAFADFLDTNFPDTPTN